MNFNNLKQFKPRNGEKYIIVEDGEPVAVILSYQDYQAMNGNLVGSVSFPQEESREEAKESKSDEEVVEMPAAVPDAPEPEDVKEKVEELKNELKRELTVDDLPF